MASHLRRSSRDHVRQSYLRRLKYDCWAYDFQFHSAQPHYDLMHNESYLFRGKSCPSSVRFPPWLIPRQA